MKELKILLCLICLSFLGLSGMAQELSEGQLRIQQMAEYVRLSTGTGETTGHIGNVVLHNDGASDATLEFGPFLIPGTSKHQGYLVPAAQEVVVPGGGSKLVKLFGYCTNINLAALPLEKEFSDFTTWVIPDGTNTPTELGWNVPEGFELNVPQELGKTPYKLTYPASDKTFIYNIAFDQFPKAASDLLLLTEQQIEQTFDRLRAEGRINTPYAQNPDKEREALIQHTFWMYTASLLGTNYSKESFRVKMMEQFTTLVGDRVNSNLSQQLDEGVEDFWSSFQLIATEANLIK